MRLAPLPPKTMLPLGTSDVMEEFPLTVSAAVGVSTSERLKAIGPVPVSSSTARSPKAEMTGGSFTGLTVRMKDLRVSLVPSLTVSVTVTEPWALVAGESVTNRFDPPPLKTMAPGGSRAGFEDAALTTSAPTGVSTSKTVKATVRGTSSSVICGPMAEISEGSFTGRTVTTKVTDAVAPSGSRTDRRITAEPC